MVTAGILPFKENSHGRAENRTRGLMISRQRLWPLNHEAGHFVVIWLVLYPEGFHKHVLDSMEPITLNKKEMVLTSVARPPLHEETGNRLTKHCKYEQYNFMRLRTSPYSDLRKDKKDPIS